MAGKKPKAKKPKGYEKLSQKEKFIAAAKAAGVDETGETFLRTFKSIATTKPTVTSKADKAVWEKIDKGPKG